MTAMTAFTCLRGAFEFRLWRRDAAKPLLRILAVAALAATGLTGAVKAQPCVEPDSGGTVTMPPASCGYVSPTDFHMIIDGLPAGTTIVVGVEHDRFYCPPTQGICTFPPSPDGCTKQGGSLGGEMECSGSQLHLTMNGTGELAGFTRNIPLGPMFETHIGPRNPGDPVQSFDTDMFALQGQLPPGDPDFDLLRITAGTGFGMPSPGHTTLTRLPDGNWNVDSFFDITYVIEFAGTPCPGSSLCGMSGSTTATIRMQTGEGAVPCCLPNGSCQSMPATLCSASGGTVVSHCPSFGTCVPPGPDCFTTACGRTLFDFCNDQIPAGFFDPGSEPFTGLIQLGGSGGTADTTVRRFDAMLLDGPPETIPIELVQLSLVSCSPITVVIAGADTLWDVQVDLSSQGTVPPGSMTVTKTHANGGTFSTQFNVLPRFTFTEVNPPTGDQVILDFGVEGRPPTLFETSGTPKWVHELYTIPHTPCGVNFVPGVEENPQTLDQCCTETCHANPTGGHDHCTKQCSVCPRGACCDPASGTCTVVEGATLCPGEYKGDGTNCDDTDGDGIPDWFENNACCQPSSTCNMATNPNNPDTDGDGVLDGEELALGCDPCVADCVEACCLPLGICVNGVLPADCKAQGGVPKGAGSVCAGDLNGDGIDDLCFDRPCKECGPGLHWIDETPCPPPDDPAQPGVCKFDGSQCFSNADCGGTCSICDVLCASEADCAGGCGTCLFNVCNKPDNTGQDNVSSGAVGGVSMDPSSCVATISFVVGGPVTIKKTGPLDDSANFPGTRPNDLHKDVVDTEILAMSLTGGGGLTLKAGTMSGTAQAIAATRGAVAEQAGDPNLADSFFDVFFEIDTGGGNFLYNQTPVRVAQVVNCLPPDANYFHISGCIPLYTSPAGGTHVANLVAANHFTYPGCCLTDGTCISASVQKCETLGGTTVASCLGDTNPANGIDDACEPKCEVDSGSPTGCTDVCPDPTTQQCLPSSYGCVGSGTCGVLDCDCDCHLVFDAAGPKCQGSCPNGVDVCPAVPRGDGSIGNPYVCECGPPQQLCPLPTDFPWCQNRQTLDCVADSATDVICLVKQARSGSTGDPIIELCDCYDGVPACGPVDIRPNPVPPGGFTYSCPGPCPPGENCELHFDGNPTGMNSIDSSAIPAGALVTCACVAKETGACCLDDGTCINTTQANCTGTFLPGVTCTGTVEACCDPSGISCTMKDPACCTASGGTPMGPGSNCSGIQTACCLPGLPPSAPTCIMADPQCCTNAGGTPQFGMQCSGNQSCCFSNGTCQDLDPLCCTSQGGQPGGQGTFCLGDANGNAVDDACEVCEPTADGSACKPVPCFGDPIAEECQKRCANFNPATGQITVTECDCRGVNDCHLVTPGGAAVAGGPNGCIVPDNGGGTVTLPPAGCDYLSPDDVHKIIDGLPPGTTIELAPIHKDFICNRQPGAAGVCSFSDLVDCKEDGGSLGGEKECSDSTMELTMTGKCTGAPNPLCDYNRMVNLPVSFETHVGPRTPGSPVQSFDTDMFALQGQLPPGDPDFDLLRITGGTGFGMPSPGHTTLTRLPGGNWAVDSFFDIEYRIDFVGAPGGPFSGMSGSTTATIRMATNAPFKCVGGCPPKKVCVPRTKVNPDGTLNVCCDCRPKKPIPDITGINKPRFISFSLAGAATAGVGADDTALRVRLVSLHNVVPPYTAGASIPFTLFEGQTQYVGPPVQYVESVSSGTPFMASKLQCAPYYQDWTTISLLHVTGEATVPSSFFDVEVLGASCAGVEDTCEDVSEALQIETGRWGDVVEAYQVPTPPVTQPDFNDIGALVNKFKSAPGAPIKARAMLAGENARGLINLTPDLGFGHISACVDGFKGMAYPYKPGKCTGAQTMACITDADCGTNGPCILCP